MKTKILLIAFLIINGVSVLAQPEYFNHYSIGGRGISQWSYNGSIEIGDFNVEGNGIVSVGTFTGDTTDFDPNPASELLLNPADGNLFVQKMDTAFNFQWAFQIGGTGNSIGISCVKQDKNGNIYISGFLGQNSTYDFNTGPGINIISAGPFVSKLFLAKYSPSGVYQWAFPINSQSTYETSIEIGLNGNIFLVGTVYGATDLDPGQGMSTNNSLGNSNMFIAEYTQSGNYVDSKVWGSLNSSGSCELYKLAFKSDGNILLLGYGGDNTALNPASTSANILADASIFLLELDSSLNFVQGFPILQSYTYGYLCQILTDTADNIYLSAGVFNAVDIDPTANTKLIIPSAGQDHVVMKFNNSGYQWSFQYGGSGSDERLSIGFNQSGQLLLFGSFEGTFDLDPGTSVDNYTANVSDFYLSKFDSAGNFRSAYILGQTGYESYPLLRSSGTEIYLNGTGSQFDLDFSANTALFNPLNGSFHFMAKYRECPTGINFNISINGNTLTANQAGASYQWIDHLNGDSPIPGATNQSFTPKNGGQYACLITIGSCTYITNLVSSSVRLEKNSLKNSLSIYPNPAKDKMIIATQNNDFLQVKITSMLGKILLSTDNKNPIPLNLPSGTYFILVEDIKGNKSTERLIIH